MDWALMRDLRLFSLLAVLALACGCAHRSGYQVQASAGYAVTYPETTWDYPSFRAAVHYTTPEDVRAAVAKERAEHHNAEPFNVAPGGQVDVLIASGRLQHIEDTEVIVLQRGQVVKRGAFKLRDADAVTSSIGYEWQLRSTVSLDELPQADAPVSVEIAGRGLDDGPYKFQIVKR